MSKPRRYAAEYGMRIVELHNQGYTARRIGQELGMPHSSVLYTLARFGLSKAQIKKRKSTPREGKHCKPLQGARYAPYIEELLRLNREG